MPTPETLQLKRRRPRRLLPLLIVLVAGGVWVWGVQQNRSLDQAIAAAVKKATYATCNSTPMPASLRWPLGTLKSAFAQTIQPHCEAMNEHAEALTTHVVRGEHGEEGVGETHFASVSIDGTPIIHLRLHATSDEEVTVLGWSLP